MKIPKFILIQSLVTIVLCLTGFFSLVSLYDQNSRLLICSAIIFSSVAGALSYAITYSGMEKSIRAFSTFLIGGMVLKMFFAIIVLTIFSLTMRQLAVPFVLAYFFSYIVFISFEVFALMTKLRPFSKKVERNSDENSGK